MRLGKSGFLLVFLLMLFVSMGIFVPAYTYTITRADASQIQLPGQPVNETAFSILVSPEPDSAIFRGNWSTESLRPYVLSYTPMATNLISQEEAVNISGEFIPAHYWEFLEYMHWAELNPNLPEWTIRFTSHVDDTGGYDGLVVLISVNAFTGRVIRYHVHWDEKANPELLAPPIEPGGNPGNRSIIETRLVQFLDAHGYSLSEEMRLIETHAWPNETHAVSYSFKIAMPIGLVLPDEAIQGVEARVDAITGEVLDFSYLCVEIPELSIDGVINPDVAYDYMITDASPWSSIGESEHVGAFLRLRLIESTHYPIRLQLVWALQLKGTDKGWLWEVHRDAFDGGRPIPNPHIIS